MSQLPQSQWTIPGGPGGPAGQIGNPYFSPGGFQAPAGGGAAAGGGAIGGALPWGQAGGGAGMFGGDLAGSYASAYNSALAMNQANYQNILQGYQQTAAQQRQAQGAIGAGYNQLYNTVMGGIQGIGQSQAQAIADTYAQQSGQQAQMLTSRGLGNTTVAESVQRGLTLDQQKAQIALANQIAGLGAGYASQLGGAALNYQNQAAMQNTALSNQQLQWQNSVQAQYPNADAYNRLYQEQGAINQANADRAALQQRLNAVNPYQGLAFGRGGGGGVAAMGPRHGMPGMETGIGGTGPAGMAPSAPAGPGMIRQHGIDPGTGMAEGTSPYQGTYGAGMIGAAAQYGVNAAQAAQYGMSPEEYWAYQNQGGIIGPGEQYASGDELAAAGYGDWSG